MQVHRRRTGPSIAEFLDDDTLTVVGVSLTNTNRIYSAVRLACMLGRTCTTMRRVTGKVLEGILKLDSAQLEVFRTAMTGRSMLITGVAGTGKSQVVRAIREVSDTSRLGVTASTGAAAAMVGGSTVHSYFGLGMGNDKVERYVGKVFNPNNRVLRDRIVHTNRVIIDEVSMMDADLFDKIAALVKAVRERAGNTLRVQFVLVGDFLQLPAVHAKTKGFVFQSKAWKDHNVKVHELTKVHRQSNRGLLEVLSRIRRGVLTPEDEAFLKQNSAQQPHEDSVKLFATNDESDHHNRCILSRMPGKIHPFKCVDNGNPAALTSVTAMPELYLKVGALVMCLKNLPHARGTLVNGSVGRVSDVRVVESPPGMFNAHVDVLFKDYGEEGDDAFEFSHTFVTGCNPDNEFSVMQKDKVVATRFQIPLRLAWGVSIHKSQGATFDKICINLENCFECGQAYVALSRARTIAGMYIQGLAKKCVKANAVALSFYKNNS